MLLANICAAKHIVLIGSASAQHQDNHLALQASAFASWKDAIAFRSVKRAALANSVKLLLQGALGRAFAAWRDNIAHRAALKQKAASCLARFAHAHTARAFSAWVDWSDEQKEHR